MLPADGEGVTVVVGGAYELAGQDLLQCEAVAERGLLDAHDDEPEGAVDAPLGGDVDGEAVDDASVADAGGVLVGGCVLDGPDQDLDWVAAGPDVYDLEGVADDADDAGLVAAAAAGAHEAVDEPLGDVHV